MCGTVSPAGSESPRICDDDGVWGISLNGPTADSNRYAPACIKLLAQYKSLMKLVSDEIGSLEAFMKRFRVRPSHQVHVVE